MVLVRITLNIIIHDKGLNEIRTLIDSHTIVPGSGLINYSIRGTTFGEMMDDAEREEVVGEE